MNRKFVIATVLLAVALVALAITGLGSAPPASGDTEFRPLLPGTMSGDFAPTKLASAGVPSAPSIDVPLDLSRAQAQTLV
jgi:hypothetical protein